MDFEEHSDHREIFLRSEAATKFVDAVIIGHDHEECF